MPTNSINQIIELLTPFNDSGRPISPSALRRLGAPVYNAFLEFLLNPPEVRPRDNISRPECPIKDEYISLAIYPYKQAMTDYIAQWGFEFEMPTQLRSTLLESTANYLENSGKPIPL